MTAEVSGDAVAGNAADPCTDRLDHSHKRKTEQHGPSQSVAELRPHLAVSGDAARIVVCGPGNQTWSQALQESDRLQRRHNWWNRRRAAGRGGLRKCDHRPVLTRRGLT